MSTQIRQATQADVGAIRRVARASWMATYGDILGEDGIEAGLDRWYDPERLADTVASEVVLVSETDGDVVGYAIATVDGGTGCVDAVYLHPAQQGRGLGARLFDALCAHLADHDVTRLESHVFTANDRALAFCRAQGFEATGTEVVPVSDGATGEMTVLERPLTGE